MRKITVSDPLQQNYTYTCSEPVGKNFDPEFTPDLTPAQMLQLGVFGGHYFFENPPAELPASWFRGVRLADKKDSLFNYFKVSASQPLSVWRQKGWIHPDDPHGWFQWYCRYYLGRRHEDDQRQIKRWKAIRRHVAQVKNNCTPMDHGCRPKQRQALLHWAYDSRKI